MAPQFQPPAPATDDSKPPMAPAAAGGHTSPLGRGQQQPLASTPPSAPLLAQPRLKMNAEREEDSAYIQMMQAAQIKDHTAQAYMSKNAPATVFACAAVAQAYTDALHPKSQVGMRAGA